MLDRHQKSDGGLISAGFTQGFIENRTLEGGVVWYKEDVLGILNGEVLMGGNEEQFLHGCDTMKRNRISPCKLLIGLKCSGRAF